MNDILINTISNWMELHTIIAHENSNKKRTYKHKNIYVYWDKGRFSWMFILLSFSARGRISRNWFFYLFMRPNSPRRAMKTKLIFPGTVHYNRCLVWDIRETTTTKYYCMYTKICRSSPPNPHHAPPFVSTWKNRRPFYIQSHANLLYRK